jgi:uncharacterized protein (TIGR02284 family)
MATADVQTAPANEQAVKLLNSLIETCRDGEKGYAAAADAVKSFDLKKLLQCYAAQRALFATELQTEVQRLGGRPGEGGSLGGSLHRGWMNLKALVTGGSDCAVLAECARGDEAALKAYEEALKTDLPSEVREILQRQQAHTKEAHTRARALAATALA